MKQLYGTEIWAKCPITGEVSHYGGPYIRASSQKEAFDYCQNNGLGYCHVNGDRIVAEIPCKDDINFEPDWEKMIDYDIIESPDNKRLYLPNQLEDWLIEKGIKLHDDGSINCCWVQEKDLTNFVAELKEKFPTVGIFENAVSENAEPKARNNNNV